MLRAFGRIRRDPPGFLADCRDRWGDVVRFPVPGRPVYLVSDPGAVLRVLRDNHPGYDKSTVQYEALAAVTGRGLLTSDGTLWRRQRRLAQPAFHPSTMPDVAARSAEAAGRLLSTWDRLPAGARVDVDAAMTRLTLDVVGAALFGTDLAAGADVDPDALVGAVLVALDAVVAGARTPLRLPGWLPTRRRRRLRRGLATLDETVFAAVRRRRAGPAPVEPDLLDLLLRAGMAERQLRDEVVTLVVAGHETVASALTWSWHLLGGDDAARTRLRAEAAAVLGAGPASRLPTYDDLPRLPWTRAVVEEALRLYPPAWVVTRRAVAPDVLAGHRINAGTLVIVSPWVLHRHPDLWADPTRFDPARFLPERRFELPRGGYLPFGAGPRLCIGREFALVEGPLLLAAVAARYDVRPVPGAGRRVDAAVTLRPRGGLPATVWRCW
jgi:cytochrome P450